jgi:DNA-binding transcriptional MerR regulator
MDQDDARRTGGEPELTGVPVAADSSSDHGAVTGGGVSGERHMQIGEVAERTGLSLRTIRFYGESGLVVPSSRSPGGFRLYTDSDVARLLVVKRMKPLGFSLEEMGDLLAVVDGLDAGPSDAEREALLDRLASHLAAAQERVRALRTNLAYAEEFAGMLAGRLDRYGRGASAGPDAAPQ